MAPSQELRQDKIHVVAIPYPAHGHIVPLMQFCKQLVALESFTITFVNTEHNHARLLQSQAHHTNLDAQFDDYSRLDDIRLIGIPGGLPPELHASRDHVVNTFQASEDLVEPFQQLLRKLMKDEPPVSYIISDVMMSWTQYCADEFGISRIAFWTSSAAVYSVIWHAYLLDSQGLPKFEATHSSLNGNNAEIISCIPGLPPMEINDLPIIVRSEPSDFIYQYLIRQLKPLLRASHIVFNTFYELEAQCIDALASASCVPIHAVGPLLPPNVLSGRCDNSNSLSRASIFSEEDGCLEWLDKQKAKSVLYISFGSIFRMSADQLLELAQGLEASQQPFLWAIRPDFVDGGVKNKLPAGFLDRTKEKGCMVPWVPQLRVLAHPAVGGFLTHCGWNSTLESVTLGVPMLCWPDVGERRTNGRLVVSSWEVGLEFTRSGDGSIVGKEVERVIRELMEGKCGQEIMARAEKLHEDAMNAAKGGGSSCRMWETLVKDMEWKAQVPRKDRYSGC